MGLWQMAYLGAMIVGLSRMEGPDGWHDHWDVLAGAAVGIGSTYLFTTPYESNKVEVSFFSDANDTYVLSMTYRF